MKTFRNRSLAVMQNRKTSRKKDKNPAEMEREDFPTPPWATRALMEHVILPVLGAHKLTLSPRSILKQESAWEPACGRGFMSEVLKEYFSSVWSSDIEDYGYVATHDVGSAFQATAWRDGADWIITNPPFNQAADFIKTAGKYARTGYAMLVRTSFLEGIERWREIYSQTPPSITAIFSERVPMVKGRCDKKASTATSYCWLVWLPTREPPKIMWIPPCRAALERTDDYTVPALR